MESLVNWWSLLTIPRLLDFSVITRCCSIGLIASVVRMSLADLSPTAKNVLESILTNGSVLASGDLSTWKGVHVLHLQVISTFADDSDMWLIDRSLPNNIHHVEPAGNEPTKVCRVRFMADVFPSWKVPADGFFACKAVCFIHEGIKYARVMSPFDFFTVGTRVLNQPANWVHTFCGSFNGWQQAVEAICSSHHLPTASVVEIDVDPTVCRNVQQSLGAKVFGPPYLDLLSPLPEHCVICCDIAQTQWQAACHNAENSVWTSSFPCPPFSKASATRPGLETSSGRAFLFALKAVRAHQPLVLCAENVEGIRSHGHFRIILRFAAWAGYKLAWSQIKCLSEISHCLRSRWLAVFVRQDLVSQSNMIGSFNLGGD